MVRLTNRLRRRKKRHLPQLNTTATADISFMLLIFFLVTTQMDSDKGLPRQLPPKEIKKDQMTDVDRQNVLTVGITADNEYTVNDSVVAEKDLAPRLADFIRQRGDKHIIEIQACRRAEYDKYFHLQNILVHVYRYDLKRKYQQRISETYVP